MPPSDNPCYRVNDKSVVQETFDDEVIVVNLDAGAYYSLEGAGARVWSLIGAGTGLDQIVAALEQEYDGPPAQMRAATESLLRELLEESLVLEDGTAAAAVGTGREAPAARPPFAAPRLTKYTDMRDLLILDPIHEVDESGWPTRRPSEG
jgi:hypothetical protein